MGFLATRSRLVVLDNVIRVITCPYHARLVDVKTCLRSIT
jgi:hypothetical protein